MYEKRSSQPKWQHLQGTASNCGCMSSDSLVRTRLVYWIQCCVWIDICLVHTCTCDESLIAALAGRFYSYCRTSYWWCDTRQKLTSKSLVKYACTCIQGSALISLLHMCNYVITMATVICMASSLCCLFGLLRKRKDIETTCTAHTRLVKIMIVLQFEINDDISRFPQCGCEQSGHLQATWLWPPQTCRAVHTGNSDYESVVIPPANIHVLFAIHNF